MAAPVGIQLRFDTTMPLIGLIMTPATLLFGPSASFNLVTILMPGLLCYVIYRVAAHPRQPADTGHRRGRRLPRSSSPWPSRPPAAAPIARTCSR